MRKEILFGLPCILLFSLATAGSNIFTSSFEESETPIIKFKINDTGITWAANNLSGNSETCISDIAADQDCHQGRDADPGTNTDTDGHAGFSFTKLDLSGVPLEPTASSWSCVRDNVTGLIWEVKTTIAGVHNRNNTYQWGGLTAIGREHPNRKGDYFDPSWNSLIQDSNSNNLCGLASWRIPTLLELNSIVNYEAQSPSIDSNYFPNTVSGNYWSSSPVASVADFAWSINFLNGEDGINNRNSARPVRLVSSDF